MNTSSKDCKLPSSLLMGGIGLILLLLSIYVYSNYFENIYPSELNNTKNFFLQFENVTKYNTNSIQLFFPLATYAIFFSLSFIAYFIIDNENFRKLAIYTIIANVFFAFLFFIDPAIKTQSFSLFHFVYFILSLIPLIYMKRGFFHLPKTPYILIFPVLLFAVNLTSSKIVTAKSSNQGVLKHEISNLISAKDIKLLPKAKNPRWIFTNGKTPDKARLKAYLFTSFTCAECLEVNRVVKKIKRQFAGYLAMQYMPFPHSKDCNPYYLGATQNKDDCEVSKLAMCLDHKNFPQIFEMLMEANINTSIEGLLGLARNAGKQDCYTSVSGQNLLEDTIQLSDIYKLKKGPVIVVNGILIPPPYSVKKLSIYLNEMISRSF